jgi:hypothetical protein
MSQRLPYRAKTSSGNQFDFEFPLHPETDSPVNVSNLLSAILEALDREIGRIGDAGNGDVLQAIAMALAVRTRMLAASAATLDPLVKGLLEAALAASVEPARANVSPDAPRDVH